MENALDYLAKIVIVGESGVGKSSIIRYVKNGQVSREHIATIGMDFIKKEIKCSKGVVKMTIWDTAGQERFDSLQKSAYTGLLIRC